MVSGFVTTRLPDDKLKEKLTACLAPKNCAGIVSPRVNPEIWEKLSTQTKSRDVTSQRTQNALVGGDRGNRGYGKHPRAILEIGGSPFRSGDGAGQCIGVARQRKPRHEPAATRRPGRRYKQRLQRPVQGWCGRIGPPLRRQPVDAH